MPTRRRATLLAFLVLGGCSGNASTPAEKPVNAETPKRTAAKTTKIGDATADPAPEVTNEIEDGVALAINRFAFDFYGKLRTKAGNVAVSPASISLAFAMTYGGARGETAEQMASVFHFDQGREALFAGYANAIERWNGSQKVELAIANRLFGEKTFTFEADFIESTRKSFGAPLTPLDFRGDAESARVEINAWVEQRTRERIKDLIPVGGLSGDTRLVLTNAIYLKADWRSVFQKEATVDREFRGPGEATKVPTMHQNGHFPYADMDEAGVRLLEMPYAGDELGMVIVLPDADDGLAAVESSLSPEVLKSWTTAMKPKSVDVALPKFKIDPASSTSLRETLVAMGMELPFDSERADFSGMATPPPPLYISDAFHKAFIEVDEKGTEAAAATAVVMAEGAGVMPEAPPKFAADHPFLFFLHDRKTGAILFMGRIEDPSR